MITELMIVLIVVGSIMVFVVWNAARSRRQRAEEQRLITESTTKLKQELEKTASEVIQRMETQAANLENLLEDADRNRTEFEGRLAELKKLIKRGESQSIEIRDLLQKLEDAGEDVEGLQQKLDAIEMKISTTLSMPLQMQQPMMPTMMQQPMVSPLLTQPMVPSPMAVPPQMMRQVPSPISPPPLRQSHISQEPPSSFKSTTSAERASVDEEPSEARDFAAVLKRSMTEEPPEEKPVARRKTIPDRPSIVLPSDKPANVVEAEPVKIETRRSTQPSKPAATPSRTATPQRQTTPSRPSATSTTSKPATAARPTTTRQPSTAPAAQRTPSTPQRTATTPTRSTQSIQSAQSRQPIQSPRPTQSIQSTQSTQSQQSPQSTAGGSVESNSAKIRNLLLAGKSVEEIARELGMGRGAVELVQEMTRRQLQRRKSP